MQRDTVIDNGPADTLGIVKITQTGDGKAIITGNKSINATQCNFQTLCIDSTGAQSWVEMYNVNLQKSYSTNATTDLYGNTIVVGCSYIDTTNLQDISIIKYDNAGVQQWHHEWNGGRNDIATDVVTDNNGNIYVCGAKGGYVTNISDYVLIGLDPSGNSLWTPQTYDYSSLLDIPVGISFNHMTQEITVSGTSGSTFNNYDIATVVYDANSGNQSNSDRISSNSAAFNMEADMVSDGSGNLYYTGRVWNGTDFDIQIVKYNSSLVLQWSHTYDGHGLDDSGTKIALDNSGNVIVTGYISRSGVNVRDAIVLKYNSAGTRLWVFPKTNAPNLADRSEGLGLFVNADNDIYVGGNATNNSNQDVFLLKLDESGNGKFYEPYDGADHGTDQFFDLLADGSEITVTSRCPVSGVLKNIVIRYTEEDLNPTFSSTHPAYAVNELIVSFNPALMNMTTINDTEKRFGKLSDFIPDSICSRINSKLFDGKNEIHSQDFGCHKIFYDMTEKDSLSTTRLGDVIKVPKFYATIVVKLPVFSGSMTQDGVNDSLNMIKPSIYYSEFNWGFRLAAGGIECNDMLWSDQYNMHSNTVFPDGHINADTASAVAWGNPSVKVGIFDSGIQVTHEDLTGLPAGGKDFSDPSWPFLNNDIDGHGTQMAGLIGATRNNQVGIAGLAGNNDSTSTIGVSIFDCKVSTLDMVGGDSLISLDKIAGAMHFACRGDSSGFAINIANQSLASDAHNQLDSLHKSKTFQDQIVFACRNGVAVAAAKSYYGDLALPCFPADWNPEIMTCVGGSGTNGERAVKQAGSNPLNNCQGPVNWGYNMDFVAPASWDLVTSTDKGNGGDYNPTGFGSAACSQVAGTYALMMSYFNQPSTPWDHLLHEDCENILRRTSTDLTNSSYSEASGWDRASGWGRINVSRAIREINPSHYRFRHINWSHSTSPTSSGSTWASSAQVHWPAFANIPDGVYPTDIQEFTTTLHYSLNPGETIIDYWPMYKECYGWSSDTTNLSIDKPYYAEIVSVNNTTAVLKTYYYHNLTYSTYAPSSPSGVVGAITLYTYDTANTGVGIRENRDPVTQFRIRPNPNSGQFNITFGSDDPTDVTYSLYDLLGREMKAGSYKSHYGENNLPVNISELPQGVYIVNVFGNGKRLYNQKVIKY